jgi:hypothetical protein
MVVFVSLGFALGTKTQGFIPTFDTLRAFCRIIRYVIYSLDAFNFASGIKNVFLDKLSNRN